MLKLHVASHVASEALYRRNSNLQVLETRRAAGFCTR